MLSAAKSAASGSSSVYQATMSGGGWVQARRFSSRCEHPSGANWPPPGLAVAVSLSAASIAPAPVVIMSSPKQIVPSLLFSIVLSSMC
jgi:hypothetical protein